MYLLACQHTKKLINITIVESGNKNITEHTLGSNLSVVAVRKAARPSLNTIEKPHNKGE